MPTSVRALLRAIAFDLTPLRISRDFRLIYLGQAVSFLGSMVTYVAVPYQVYALTRSTLAVGLLGAAELGPMLALALVGGALADAHDRRRMVLIAEAGLSVCCALLAANATLAHPSVPAVFVLAGLMAGLGGLHRPALEAMTPRLLHRDLMPAAAALHSFRGNLGMIAGPALGGLLIAYSGMTATYLFDLSTFAASLAALSLVANIPPPEGADRPGLSAIKEGLRYASRNPVLLGTYLVDMNAMIFGMPMALFPAIAEWYGGSRVVGLFYSAPAVGALLVTVTSGWAPRVSRHGLAVAVAAAVWGAGIVGFGLAHSLWWSLAWLAVAGGADMVSGLFRSTIWNQTVPDRLRGRLAGIEQISYHSGPLLGHLEAGLVAAMAGIRVSVVSGGLLAMLGSVGLAWVLPAFTGYRAPGSAEPASGGAPGSSVT
jgi:MFS family permease